MSSSIFNFDGLRAAIRLPLRTHAWHALLCAAAVIALGFTSNALSRLDESGPPPANRAASLADREALILGDSQFQSLQASVFHTPTINLAQGGADYVIARAVLFHHAPRMPRLKTVILEFDNIPLNKDGMGDRKGDYDDIVALGLPWYALPIPYTERAEYGLRQNVWTKPFFAGPKLSLDEVGRLIALPGAEAATTDTRDPFDVFNARPGFFVPPAHGQKKMSHYVATFRKANLNEANRAAFLDILGYCAAHDLNVLLARPYTSCAFELSRPASWVEELLDLLESAEARYGDALHARVIETRKHLAIGILGFSDPNHLPPFSAEQVAALLDGQLDTDAPLDDRLALSMSAESPVDACDCREDLWVGYNDGQKRASIRILEDVPLAEGVTASPFEVRLAPKKPLFFKWPNPIAAGTTVQASASFWIAEGEATPNLALGVARNDDGTYEAAFQPVGTLDTKQREVRVRHTFTQGHDSVRLQLENRGTEPVAVRVANVGLRFAPPAP